MDAATKAYIYDVLLVVVASAFPSSIPIGFTPSDIFFYLITFGLHGRSFFVTFFSAATRQREGRY